MVFLDLGIDCAAKIPGVNARSGAVSTVPSKMGVRPSITFLEMTHTARVSDRRDGQDELAWYGLTSPNTLQPDVV